METILLYGLLGLIIWQVILTVLFIRFGRFLKAFTKGISTQDLATLLAGIGASLKKIHTQLDKVQAHVVEMDTKAEGYFQNMGFVRYNPFSDTGGDQSFCLCLLDNFHSGVVITSLHSRDHTRIYAKPILKGKSDAVALSKEEELALQKALSSSKITT